jgi:hypothetical protein
MPARTNRRTFIAGLGSAAAWPLLRNQQRAANRCPKKIAIKSEIKGVTLAIKKERLP